MPTIPTADNINRARLQPSTNVVQYRSDQVGRALEQAGHVVQRTAERVNNVMDEVADTHARGAIAELKRRQNQLTVGENGYARLLNGSATEPGVVQKYKELHDKEVADIAGKLSPAARNKFTGMATRASATYEAGVLTHIMRQDLNHRGQVYEDNVAVSAETASINYNNPQVLLEERANLDRTVAGYVAQNGLKDKAVIERTLQDARGKFHQSVINAYVENDQVHNAEAYFEAVKQEMTPERAKAVTNMMKPEVANRIGRDVSDKMFQMHLEGKSESDILEEQLKLTEGKPKETLSVANQLYKARVNALEEDRVKTGGALLLDAFNGAKGSGLTDARLREIDAQDPQLGLQIRNKMQAIQKRREADAGGGRAIKAARHTDMAVYGALAESIRNGENVTDEHLMQFADRLKESDVRGLMKLRVEQREAAGKYKIPTAILNAGMPKRANTPEEKNAYKGYVEEKLREWKDANPGKRPTPQEEKDIIRSASEEHVSVGFFNTTVGAYEAEGKKTYPKSFGSLMRGADDDDILSAYAYAQRVRARANKGERFTDAQLIALWQKRNKRTD